MLQIYKKDRFKQIFNCFFLKKYFISDIIKKKCNRYDNIFRRSAKKKY